MLAFVRIGLVPDSGLTRTLVRALGRHRATALIFGWASRSRPRRRMAAGLVHGVVPGSSWRPTSAVAAQPGRGTDARASASPSG